MPLDFSADKAAKFTAPSLLAFKGRIPLVSDTVLRVFLSAVSSIPCDVQAVLTVYDLVDVKVGEFVLINKAITQTTALQAEVGEKVAEWGMTAFYARLSLRMLTAGAELHIDDFGCMDVTAEDNRARAVFAREQASSFATNAEGSAASASESATLAATSANTAGEKATAAAGSATSASTSADASAQSATASDASRVAAETAKSDAESSKTSAASSATSAAGSASSASTSETNAASSRDAASGHAANAKTSETNSASSATTANDAKAVAITARDTAVAVSSQGTGVLSDQFCHSAWGNWNTGPVRRASTTYPTGQEWEWNFAAGVQAGVQLVSSHSLWTGPIVAPSYRVDIEYTLVTGGPSGAGLLFDYYDGVNHRVTKHLADMTVGGVVVGKKSFASATFDRPAAAVAANLSYLRIYLMMNYSVLGDAAKNIIIHRIQAYPITSTEAAVKEQASAIADLQGNASAGYLVKVQAGGAVSLLDLVAADDGVSSPTSVAKLKADQIILDGEVYGRHIHAGEITATHASFTSLEALSLTAGTRDMVANSISESVSNARTASVDVTSWHDYLGVYLNPATPFAYDTYVWARLSAQMLRAGVRIDGVRQDSVFELVVNDEGGSLGDGVYVGVFKNMTGEHTLHIGGERASTVVSHATLTSAAIIVQMVKR